MPDETLTLAPVEAGERPSNKDYLGDSVYEDFDGFSIILTTENGYPDDQRNRIALEPEVMSALLAFNKRMRSPAKPESAADDGGYLESITREMDRLKLAKSAIAPFAAALMAAGIPEPYMASGECYFYHPNHGQIIAIIRIIGGKWNKTVADGDKITYTREEQINGITIQCYKGEPPPSCRIEEIEEDVPAQPAGKRIVRKLVCKE